MVEESGSGEEQLPAIGAPLDNLNNPGIVYVLTNAAMQGYIKIGRTNGNSASDVQRRMKELDSTGVPRAFDCEYAAIVNNYQTVEKALHTAFGDYRVRESREFFEGLSPHRVKAILDLSAVRDVTPEGKGELDDAEPEKPPRRPNFNFSMIDIPVGATLQWVDNPDIQCEVIDNKRVSYEGQNWAISPLAQRIKEWDHAANGTLYWLYEGETLQERRDRLEREGAGEDE